MCGICGFTGPPDSKSLKRMVASLHHRGPDSEGFRETPKISLGMRRLAIIDVETGDQPVFNETGTVAAVFNGEIYNYVELREDLARAGHSFRSDHSDSEVIVHLYEEHGLDFVHHLNGMFAIALWDDEADKLVLVRDRAGIKPLYYCRTAAGDLVFGSEPKALLVHPRVGRDPDFKALHHFLSLKNIPAPMSAYREIRQLGHGEMAVLEGGRLSLEHWWRLRFEETEEVDEDEAAARILELLEDSVRLQMRSDVPIGAYLSGGLDSSAVVALMSRLGAGNINTYTLVYEDELPNKDADRAFAREVAEQCGTRHHEQVVTAADIPSCIDDVLGSFDEPFSGVISTYFLTRRISQDVKVALSGDGADELFASYIGPRLARPLHVLEQKGGASGPFSGDEEEALGDWRDDIGALKRILDRGDEAARRMGQYLYDDDQKTALYSPFMKDQVGSARTEDLIRDVYRSCGSSDPLNRALFLDFQTILPDQVLPFVDRLSMAHSVEVRPAFLDHRLIEYAATLPGRLKIRNGRVKHILKKALRGLLPDALVDRPKEGFIMPVNDWLLGRLGGFVSEHLAPERLARHGMFAPGAIEAVIDDHFAGRKNNGNQIWCLLMLQLWWERYVD